MDTIYSQYVVLLLFLYRIDFIRNAFYDLVCCIIDIILRSIQQIQAMMMVQVLLLEDFGFMFRRSHGTATAIKIKQPRHSHGAATAQFSRWWW